MATPRYRLREVVGFHVGGTNTLLTVRETGVAHVVPHFVSQVAARSTYFDTLERHAQDACAELRIGRDRLPDVLRELQRLVQLGFMVAETELVAAASSGPALGQPLEHIAVVTGDGPDRREALVRCVRSFAENASAFEHEATCSVYDLSRDPAAREETRRRLAALGARVRYAGPEDKRAYAARLAAEAGVAPALVELALLDPLGLEQTPGANRNAALLDLAGERFALVTDETACTTAHTPGLSTGLVVASKYDPAELSPHPNADAVRAAVTPQPLDFLGAHGRVLGASVGACIADAASVDFVNASGSFATEMERGRAVVRVTWTGYYGDAGLDFPAYPLFLGGRSHKHLVKDEQHFVRCLESRQVVRGAQRLTIIDRDLSPSVAIGIDNRGLMPPCPPVMGGEEAVFAAAFSATVQGAAVGYLPLLVDHRPVSSPTGSWEAVARAAAIVKTYAILIRCLATFEPEGGATDLRMRAAGRHLQYLGSLPVADFFEYVRLHQWQFMAAVVTSLERRLRQERELPPFWARAVQGYIAAYQAAAADPDFGIADDLRQPARDRAIVQTMSRDLVRRYGELIEAWPDIHAAAARLRIRGEPLSSAVRR